MVKVMFMRPNNFFLGGFSWYVILVIAFCFITFYQALITLILCARFQVFLLFIDLIILFFGLFYIGVLIDFIVLTMDDFARGNIYVWLIFIIAFVTDIFAYFAGYLFGKHKLIPKVSPKKTIEGSVSGILGSVVFCMLFGYLFPVGDGLQLWEYAVIGVAGGIVSQFGDLTASIFKRKIGIKDYGTLIPGHGGIMDRFDSVLFTAPMVYYTLYILNAF